MSSSKNRINSQINQLVDTLVKNTRGNVADFSTQDTIANQGNAGDGEIIETALLEDVDEVQPGDLITAELMNELLSRLMRLEAIVLNLAHPDKGKIKVPNLFGVKLPVAQKLLTDRRLRVGKVIDIFGQDVALSSSWRSEARVALRSEEYKLYLKRALAQAGTKEGLAEELLLREIVRSAGAHVVLAHFPVPNALAQPGTTVNLLVSFDLASRIVPQIKDHGNVMTTQPEQAQADLPKGQTTTDGSVRRESSAPDDAAAGETSADAPTQEAHAADEQPKAVASDKSGGAKSGDANSGK